MNTFYTGDALAILKTMPSESVHCCVTSPAYWGLRDYGVEGQIGLEQTPEEYVNKLVNVFREVKRVLRNDGTLWLNLGDTYMGGGRGGDPEHNKEARQQCSKSKPSWKNIELKSKDLVGIPWMVAFALRADGWYLRQDIIWSKTNPMPESVTDRCTKSHEYIFLLSKSKKYYYDAAAISESVANSTVKRLSQDLEHQKGSKRVQGKTNGNMKAVAPRYGGNKYTNTPDVFNRTKSGNIYEYKDRRNKRSVWTISTKPFKGAHFAVFPPDLVKPCILAGSPMGGVVLDPFGGSGTVAMVASELGRDSIYIDLNPQYTDMAKLREVIAP
jgi:DNA modification methylase